MLAVLENLMHQLPRGLTHIMCVVQANNDRRLLNAIVLVIAVVAVFTANLVTKTIIV